MRKNSKIVSLVTLGLVAFTVAGCSSDARDIKIANELVTYTERAFLNPISQETALELIQSDTTVNMEVLLPNGSLKDIAFKDYTSFWGFKSLVPVDSNDAKELELDGWVSDAEVQRTLYRKYDTFSSIEKTYNITLSTDARNDLQMPDEEPTALSRYGTTNILIPQDDGTFYNGPVTLIWDDGTESFKLIYSQGAGIDVELSRVG